jgi:hypothetical protein
LIIHIRYDLSSRPRLARLLNYRQVESFFSEQLLAAVVHQHGRRLISMMVEQRSAGVAVRVESPRSWSSVVLQGSSLVLERTGIWAADTAQQFGALVAALMGPAVLSVYAFVAWSLAANLGWTDTFVFRAGPLSNWMIWMGLAVLVSLAANILRKRSRLEQE